MCQPETEARSGGAFAQRHEAGQLVVGPPPLSCTLTTTRRGATQSVTVVGGSPYSAALATASVTANSRSSSALVPIRVCAWNAMALRTTSAEASTCSAMGSATPARLVHRQGLKRAGGLVVGVDAAAAVGRCDAGVGAFDDVAYVRPAVITASYRHRLHTG